MSLTVAIVAAGNMGAAIGARLQAHGVQVLTSLEGRSPATAERARAAGMQPVSEERLASAHLLLSIVPPGAALDLARRLAPQLSRARPPATFVDCNAISPRTAECLRAVIEGAGAACIDAGIIGPPPQPQGPQPVLYASGEQAQRLAELCRCGLDVRCLAAPFGAASALKMSYGGITKGLTAVGTAMLLAAEHAGVAATLLQELAAREPALLACLKQSIPRMFPKAYRWVAEMRHIADFAREDPATAALYEGAALLYERMAHDVEGEGHDVALLTQRLGGKRDPQG